MQVPEIREAIDQGDRAALHEAFCSLVAPSRWHRIEGVSPIGIEQLLREVCAKLADDAAVIPIGTVGAINAVVAGKPLPAGASYSQGVAAFHANEEAFARQFAKS